MKDTLSTGDCAEILELYDKSSIKRKIDSGFLKAQKIGRNWVINKQDLKKYIDGLLIFKSKGKSYEKWVRILNKFDSLPSQEEKEGK